MPTIGAQSALIAEENVAGSMRIIDAVVRPAYSHREVVESYQSASGLWLSEGRLVDVYFPQAGRVLDVGCGTGRVALALARRGFDVLGIDLSTPMIACAKKRAREEPGIQGDVQFREMNALATSLPSESFDGVLFAFNGIEFIPRYSGKRALLAEVRRVLKPGACFIFCAHNAWCLNGHLRTRLLTLARIWTSTVLRAPVPEKETGEFYSSRPEYEAAYTDIKTPAAYRRMVEEAGLRLEAFNSRRGIEHGRKYRPLLDLHEPENFVFFVCRRPVP